MTLHILATADIFEEQKWIHLIWSSWRQTVGTMSKQKKFPTVTEIPAPIFHYLTHNKENFMSVCPCIVDM